VAENNNWRKAMNIFSRIFNFRKRTEFLSPKHLLQWALVFVVAFVVVELAGLREFTSILNGTVGSTTLDRGTAAFLGILYVAVYLGVVVLVPILILAAGILKIWRKFGAKEILTNESRSNSEKNKTTHLAFHHRAGD
jgi:hypothetical protein